MTHASAVRSHAHAECFLPSCVLVQSSAQPGYFTLFECTLSLLLIATFFDDNELLPSRQPPKQPSEVAHRERHPTVHAFHCRQRTSLPDNRQPHCVCVCAVGRGACVRAHVCACFTGGDRGGAPLTCRRSNRRLHAVLRRGPRLIPPWDPTTDPILTRRMARAAHVTSRAACVPTLHAYHWRAL
jgi:hypothetical protein